MSPRAMQSPAGHRGMVDEGEGGDSGGGIDNATSTDGSIKITNPHGPTTDFAVATGLESVDTSPLSAGQLAWLPGPGIASPTDNLAARASQVVAVFAGGKLRTSGTWAVAFTTQGGKPANGSPVYLAASLDDSSSGVGKATAIKPGVGMPYPLYPQGFPENPVIVGKCIDNSNYDGGKTCLVELALPGSPEPAAMPANQNLVGAELTDLSTTPGNFLSFPVTGPTADQFAARAGQSLVILFSVERGDLLTGLNDLWSTINLPSFTDGWIFGQKGGPMQLEIVVGGTDKGALSLGGPRNGLNCAAMAIDAGGVMRGCMNGDSYAVGAYSALPAVGVGFFNLIGGDVPGQDGWKNVGAFYACAVIDRSATDAELIAWSGAPYNAPPLTPAQPTRSPIVAQSNRYQLPAGVLTDPALAWTFAAQVGVGPPTGATAGPKGTAFDYTINGAPTALARQFTWYRSLAPLFIDTEPAVYDARGYARTDPGARISFQITNLADLYDLAVAWSNDDFDNSDNGAICWFINGVPQTPFPLGGATPTGDPAYFYLAPLASSFDPTAPPWQIDLLVPDKLLRIQTFKSGGVVAELLAPQGVAFETSATAARLVVVGDDDSIGHDTSVTGDGAPFANSFTTLLRADFPGRVTCHSQTSGGVFGAWQGGNFVSMKPFAQRIVAAGLEGAPAAVTVYFALGFYADYFEAGWSPALFGTHYGLLLDALHALQPSWLIYVQTCIQDAFDATPNGSGFTLTQFNAQITALATGRPWLHVVNARVPNVITFSPGSSVPFARPDQTGGTAAWKANVKAILGY